jgi:hypothetical protein
LNIYKLLKSKIFWSLILFATVFVTFAFCIHDLWFKGDDLGSIINGLVKKWSDIPSIFSADTRFYMTPMNYKFSRPNFISALYRPIQYFFFTAIYFLFGLNAYIFYLLNVFFHALNTALIFYLFSFWLPIYFSFVAGLMFAFSYDAAWLTWISTLQNPLSTFFLLLTIIFYKAALLKNNKFKYYLSGLMFLLSLLSRENGAFFVVWIFIGAFLFCSDDIISFWGRIKHAFSKTWIFFVVSFLYVLLRMWAFGFSTLSRTFNNLFLRFSFLSKLFNKNVEAIAPVIQSTNSVQTPVSTYATHVMRESFCEKVLNKLFVIMDSFLYWTANLFNFWINSFLDKILILILFLFCVVFLFYAYRNSKKILLFLFVGFFCFAWPGFLAYPNPRYISSVYPLMIFTFVFGIYLFSKECAGSFFKKIILIISIVLVAGSIWTGFQKNIRGIKSAKESSLVEKEKYAKFFRENSFEKNVNFIVISEPFESDIQNIFQYFLNDLNIKLSCELMATLAQKGCMGCHGDYKIFGVRSEIKPVKIDGKFGLRLISLEKDKCAWWMDFSFHPMKWSCEEKAYVWTYKKPEVGIWHDFSMGKFLINERLENRYITDVIFVFDDEWIDENTVFVTWDTMNGKYKVFGKAIDLLKVV